MMDDALRRYRVTSADSMHTATVRDDDGDWCDYREAMEIIERLTRERDEARALAMHETEVARQEIRARTSAQNAKRAAEEAEIRCAAELDEALNILARHRGALMRIASGDAGDWKCHCPASEISNAELEEG